MNKHYLSKLDQQKYDKSEIISQHFELLIWRYGV